MVRFSGTKSVRTHDRKSKSKRRESPSCSADLIRVLLVRNHLKEYMNLNSAKESMETEGQVDGVTWSANIGSLSRVDDLVIEHTCFEDGDDYFFKVILVRD